MLCDVAIDLVYLRRAVLCDAALISLFLRCRVGVAMMCCACLRCGDVVDACCVVVAVSIVFR